MSDERSEESKRRRLDEGVSGGVATIWRMTGYAYLLKCADGTFYAGSTRHLGDRVAQHQSGLGSAYTRRRLPVTLVWSQEFDRIDLAFAWEKRIQGWNHAKRQALIDGGLDAVSGWSARTRALRR